LNALQFDYPTPYLFLCAFVAILYGVVLYYKDMRWAEKSSALPWFLGILRTLVVFILCLLLLSPFLTYFESKTEEPLVLLAIDDSESMTIAEDSVLQEIQKLPQLLNEKMQGFEQIDLKFGDEVSALDSSGFEQAKTNISAVIDYAKEDLRGRNIGGLVLVTDGMYNLGQNPLYSLSGLNVPIFPIAVGDTTIRKDISLVDIFHNDIAYLGDKFLVQADIKANACQGKATNLSLYAFEKGQPRLLDRKVVDIEDASYFQTFEFTAEANNAGVQKFMISVEPISGETTPTNNSKTFYIDVINARQKILIAAGAPHPDISAIKQSLSKNKNYEIDVILARDPLPPLESYDLAILHQLPFKKNKPSYLDELVSSSLPKLFVTGLDTDFKKLNKIQNSLRINLKRGSANAVAPSLNPNFNTFSFAEESAQALTNYPPLETVFADFQMPSGGQILFYQQIGEVPTEYPLVMVGRTSGKTRTAFLLGEGFWRWRLYEFDRAGGNAAADQLLEQLVQYLSVADDKRRFRTQLGKNVYDENERIQIRAEFYNQNYQLVNSSDAFLEVSSADGDTYTYTLGKKDNFYQLNLGFLPEGEYSYSAYLDWNGERFSHRGQFVVKEIQLELFRTQADHNILRLLAAESGGQMMKMSDLESSLKSLREGETAQPILYSQPTTRTLINLPWVFVLIMVLLSVEWFIRRWVGSY